MFCHTKRLPGYSCGKKCILSPENFSCLTRSTFTKKSLVLIMPEGSYSSVNRVIVGLYTK
jgi:hypothetical protein